MTQEDKELLLRDLCCRLPYGVICHYETVIPMIGDVINNGELQEIKHRGEYFIVNGATCLYEDIKPYLRPMSSMTDIEAEEYTYLWNLQDEFSTDLDIQFKVDLFDWLNKNHFDYCGLIEKGLAVAVTEENNPYKNDI